MMALQIIGILLLTISATARAQYRPPRLSSSGYHNQNGRGAPLATSASKDRPYVSIPIVLMPDGQVVPKPTQASYQYLGNLPGHLSSVQGSSSQQESNYQVVMPTSHPSSQGLLFNNKKSPSTRNNQQRHQNVANFLNLATQLGAQELQRTAKQQASAQEQQQQYVFQEQQQQQGNVQQMQKSLQNAQHQARASQQEAHQQKHQEQQQQSNVFTQAQQPQVQQMQMKSLPNTQQYANSIRQPAQQVSVTQQQQQQQQSVVHFPQGRQQAYQQQTHQHGYNPQGAPMANPSSSSSKQQFAAPQPVLEIYDVNSQAVNQAHLSVNQMGQQQYTVATDPNASLLGYPNPSYQQPQVSQNYHITTPQDQQKAFAAAYQTQQSSQGNVPNVVQQGNSNGSPQQPYLQNVYTTQNGQTVQNNNQQPSNSEPSPQLVSYSFVNEQQQQPKQESPVVPNNGYQIPSGYQLTPPPTNNNYQNPATFSNANNYQTSVNNAANYQSSSPSSYQSSPNQYQSANPSYQTANQESNSYQTSNQESNSYQTAINQESNGYQAANNNYPTANQASSVPQSSSSQTNNYQSSVPSSNYQSPVSSTNNYQSSAPSTSNNYQSSAPSTSNNYQSSAPSTSNNYQSSAPSTSTNYQSSAPSTTNNYQSSAPSTNSYSVPATSSYQIASYQNPQQSATTLKHQESSNSGGQLIYASTSAKQINYSPSDTSTQQQTSPAQSYSNYPSSYKQDSSSTPSASSSGLVTPGSTYVKLSQSMAASLGVTSPSDQDNEYEDADEEETSYKVVYIPLDILKNILTHNNIESNQRSDKES